MKAQIFPEVTYEFVSLSRKSIETAYEEYQTITGYVEGILADKEILRVKLGEGIFGTLPFSEVSIYPFNYNSRSKFSNIPVQVYTLLNKVIRVKVFKITDNDIILSRKANMIQALKHLKNCTTVRFHIASLGQTIAFGDIGDGICACLKSKDVCKARIRNISEYFHKGDVIWTNIVNVNYTNRFLVSYKATFAPYDPADYQVGDVYRVRVLDPVDDDISGYYIDAFPNVSGIMDASPDMPLFYYGERIECSVRNARPSGLKLKFLRVLPK